MIQWQVNIENSVIATVGTFSKVLVFVRTPACEGLGFGGGIDCRELCYCGTFTVTFSYSCKNRCSI